MNQRDVPSPFDAISEISRFRRNRKDRVSDPLIFDDLVDSDDGRDGDDWSTYLSQAEEDRAGLMRMQQADSRLRDFVTLSATMMCCQPRESTAWETLKANAVVSPRHDHGTINAAIPDNAGGDMDSLDVAREPEAVSMLILGDVSQALESELHAGVDQLWSTDELIVLAGAHALFVPASITGNDPHHGSDNPGDHSSVVRPEIVSGLQAIQPDYVFIGSHTVELLTRPSGLAPPRPVELLQLLLHFADEDISTHLITALAPVAVQLMGSEHHSVRVQRYDMESHDEADSYALARFGERSRQGPWVDLGGLMAHREQLSYLDATECEPWDLFLIEARAPETLPVTGVVQLHNHGAPRKCVGIPTMGPESLELAHATAVAQRAMCDSGVLSIAFGELIDQVSSCGYSHMVPDPTAPLRTSFLCPSDDYAAVLESLDVSGFEVTPEPLALQTEMVRPSATVTWSGSTAESGPIAIDIYKTLSIGPFSELITFDAFERHALPLAIGGEWILTLHPQHRFILHCLVSEQRIRAGETPQPHLFDSMIMTAPQSEEQLHLTSERAERWGVMNLMLDAVQSCVEHAGGLPPWLVDRAARR